MKKQVVVIHGGMVFGVYEEYLEFLRNYKIDLEKLKRGNWKEALQKDLGEEYEVISPKMPSKYNAKYEEWKIWLGNFFPFLSDGVIMIGSSLGSMFLAKYLAENDFPVKISQLHLLAGPLDDESNEHLGDFKLSGDLEKISEQVEKIFLYHSQDDPVVPFSELEKYAEKLPKAQKMIFKDKGHFNKEMKIPELIENIKNN